MLEKLCRFLPITIIAIIMIIVIFSSAYKAISFDTLKQHHRELQNLADDHALLTPILFMSVYATATALCVPRVLFLSMIGGYLFPQPMSTIYVVIGATMGASLLFLAARKAVGKPLRKKAVPWISKMRKRFQKNAANYLLFLRFVPLFPFWLVNLAPSFFNVHLWTYIWTTFLGIIPGAFVLCQAGRGLNAIFEAEKEFSVEIIFNPQIKIALICLGIFSILPIFFKKSKKTTK